MAKWLPSGWRRGELGLPRIDVIIAEDMDEIDRQLWEIDENLMRAEHSPAQLADYFARRERLPVSGPQRTWITSAFCCAWPSRN